MWMGLHLNRWIESICGQYLSHIYGKRQARDISRTLEIFKTVAASETNINYTVLMMLRNKTLTSAMPKIMFCSMIDPIHIHEIPRYVLKLHLHVRFNLLEILLLSVCPPSLHGVHWMESV